jgi:Domain of unknown function (DUF397)
MSTPGLRWWKSSRSGSSGGQCVEVAVQWRKSSRSNSEGGNCVEVAAQWRKSSRSGSSGGACVEVADAGTTWFVRDSKNPEAGMLSVDEAGWQAFVSSVKLGAL